MKKFSAWIVVAAASALAVSGCHKSGYVKEGQIERTIDQQALGKNYIEAIGIGAADSAMTNQTQRMATSRNAAIVAGSWNAMVSHRVRLESAKDLDADVKRWLKQAYDAA